MKHHSSKETAALYLSGLSIGEVATKLGIGQSAVYSALANQKVELRKRVWPTGPNHPNWLWDNGKPIVGRMRCRYWIKLKQLCEICQTKPAKVRHHIDENPFNNEPKNIQSLCHKCHLNVHGTIQKMQAGQKAYNALRKPEPRPCSVCKQRSERLSVTRCSTCYSYFRDHGYDRPQTLIKRSTAIR